MAINTIADFNIGDEVKFNTYNSYQLNAVRGIVEGVVNASVARSISDIVKYHEEVASSPAFPDPPWPVLSEHSVLDYVIIRTDSGLFAYGDEWIDYGTAETVTIEGDATIILRNVNTTDITNALSALANINIAAKVVT